MQQGSAQTLERVRWVSSVYQHLVAQAGRIGATATDSAELALQKRLIVSLSVGLLPLTFLWSVIYFAAGAPPNAPIAREAVHSPQGIFSRKRWSIVSASATFETCRLILRMSANRGRPARR